MLDMHSAERQAWHTDATKMFNRHLEEALKHNLSADTTSCKQVRFAPPLKCKQAHPFQVGRLQSRSHGNATSA